MGGVGHFQLAGIFFHVHCPCRTFFLEGEGKSPWEEGVGIGGGNSLLPQSYVDTHHNLNPKFKQIFFTFHTVVLLSCKNYPRGKHNQVSDTSKCYRLKLATFLFWSDVWGNINFIDSLPL